MTERGALLARIRQMRARLKTTPRLMAKIGKILVASCREAFLLQRLGNLEWSVRYGGILEPPFLNIAGALHDFIAGKAAPSKMQFLDQPALLTTGALRNSIESRVVGENAVSVGTPLSYAAIHQEGGRSTQTYGEDVKDRIRAWLYKRDGGARKGREGFEKHLAPLLDRNELTTQVEPRPFVGVTEEAELEIQVAVRAHFQGVRV